MKFAHRDPYSIRVIAVVFFLVGSLQALGGGWLDDEGYLTYLNAICFADAPVDFLFFQKFRPSTAIVYTPFALMGWQAFLVAHVAVSAVAVYCIGRVVQRLGGPGALAALVLACTPGFFVAAVTGQSNAEAVAVQALVLFLHFRGGRAMVMAGFIAGFAFWTRYEVAPILMTYGLFLIFIERDRFATLAFLAYPMCYLVGSAVYHGDVLSVLHYPPAITQMVPGNTSLITLTADWQGIIDLAWSVTLAVPIWPLLFTVRLRNLPPLYRWLTAVFLVEVLLLVVLPMGGFFFEAGTIRHNLVLLPIAIILVAIGGTRPAGLNGHAERTAIPVSTRRVVLWIACVVTAIALAPVKLQAFGRLEIAPSAKKMLELTRAMPSDAVIFTNDQRLAMAFHNQEDRRTVRFIAHYDIIYELAWLSNGQNGQTGRVLKVIGDHFLGGAIWPCAIGELKLKSGDRFITNGDDRLYMAMDKDFWKKHTRLIGRSGHYELRAPRPGISRMTPGALDKRLDPRILNQPCR